MTQYRQRLPNIPEAIKQLPVSKKGYPVPYFVAKVNGEWDFRVVDPEKFRSCVRDGVCYICGQPLESPYSFVAGSLMLVNSYNVEPPMHHDCAVFSVQACPFLTLPKSVRREAGMPEHLDMPGTAVNDNPGVAVVYTVRSYVLAPTADGVAFKLPKSGTAEWYREGRPATREEAMHLLDEAVQRMASIVGESRWAFVKEDVEIEVARVHRTLLPAA